MNHDLAHHLFSYLNRRDVTPIGAMQAPIGGFIYDTESRVVMSRRTEVVGDGLAAKTTISYDDRTGVFTPVVEIESLTEFQNLDDYFWKREIIQLTHDRQTSRYKSNIIGYMCAKMMRDNEAAYPGYGLLNPLLYSKWMEKREAKTCIAKLPRITPELWKEVNINTPIDSLIQTFGNFQKWKGYRQKTSLHSAKVVYYGHGDYYFNLKPTRKLLEELIYKRDVMKIPDWQRAAELAERTGQAFYPMQHYF